jgi:pimeloyl-ACP methyl ester carboxylesterase
MGRRLVAIAFATALLGAAPKAHQAQIQGDRLAYVVGGRGPPVVFVHGGFQDYRMWLRHMPVFAERYRVVAYSRQNHFPNSSSPSGMPDSAADVHGDDLAELVTQLHLGPVNVGAHSAGAHAALFFAARHPELVHSLVIVEPPASGLLTNSPEDAKAGEDFRNHLAAALKALAGGDDQGGIKLFANAVGGPGTYDGRTAEQKAMMADNVAAHIADATPKRARPRFDCAMASHIRAPVLIISGIRSPDYFHRIVAHLATCLPNSRVRMIDASHSVPNEAPEAFDQAVLKFLKAEPRR